MKRVIIGGLFVVTQALSLAAAAQMPDPAGNTKSALQLILIPDHIVVSSDGNFILRLKWVNQSDRNIFCETMGAASDEMEGIYTYEVRTSAGTSVPRVPPKNKHSLYPTSPCLLGPGRSFEAGIGNFMNAFDMRRPGVYTIQVSLPDPQHLNQVLGTSNKVTVTVQAPHAKVPVVKAPE